MGCVFSACLIEGTEGEGLVSVGGLQIATFSPGAEVEGPVALTYLDDDEDGAINLLEPEDADALERYPNGLFDGLIDLIPVEETTAARADLFGWRRRTCGRCRARR